MPRVANLQRRRRHTRQRYPAKLLALLGKLPDEEVARRFGRGPAGITMLRIRLGIVASAPKFDWTPARDRRLGRASDRDLAREWRLHFSTVSKRRRKLGIPVYRPNLPPAPWAPYLGKLSDEKLARRFRIPVNQIRRRRRALGIKAFPRGTIWTAKMDAMLREGPVAELARAWNLQETTIRKRRILLGIGDDSPLSRIPWTKAMLAQLGNRPDTHLAKVWGLCYATVSLKRRSLGIPRCPVHPLKTRWTAGMRNELGRLSDHAFALKYKLSDGTVRKARNERGIARQVRRKISWTGAQRAMLGQMPDHLLAKRLGVSQVTVSRMRRALSVPAYKPR